MINTTHRKINTRLTREQEDILKHNKLIAEFMGGIYSKYANAWGFGNVRIEHKEFKIQDKVYQNAVWAERFEKELKYHSSWDWLMPVVEQIKTLKRLDKLNRISDLKIYHWVPSNKAFGYHHSKFLMSIRFEELYEAVIEFILWYNEKVKK